MNERRSTVALMALATLAVLGLMNFVLPLLRTANARPTATPFDVEGTVDARLTQIAVDVARYQTATQIINVAVAQAVTQTAEGASLLNNQTSAAQTATAGSFVTQTVSAQQDMQSTVGAVQATNQAILARQTSTAAAATATVGAIQTRNASVAGRAPATAEAVSILRGALENTQPLTAANATRIGSLVSFLQAGPVDQIAISADGNRLASASGETVMMHNLTTGEMLQHLDVGTATSLVFSPDSSLLAIATLNGPIVVTTTSIEPRPAPLMLQGHTDSVLAIAFSPDGTLLASAGADATRLWDVAAGAQLLMLPTGPTWDVRFSPDGRYVITAGGDGSVRVWGVPIVPVNAATRTTPVPTPVRTAAP